MGKNIYIQADGLTDEEERIGDFRGWYTPGDVFLHHADVGDPEQKKRDEEGYSYYAGPYVITPERLRELIPDAQAVERTDPYWIEEFDTPGRVVAFVDLYERLEREGRHPTLWICI